MVQIITDTSTLYTPDEAKALGFEFSVLKDWIYELLDYYIALVK